MQTEECKINEAQSVFGPSSQSLTQRRHSKGGILLAALCTPEQEVFSFLFLFFCRSFSAKSLNPHPKPLGTESIGPWSPSGQSSQENPEGDTMAKGSPGGTDAQQELLSRGPPSASFRGSGAGDRETMCIRETWSFLPPPTPPIQRRVLLSSPSTQVSESLRGNPSTCLWGSVSLGLPLLVKGEEEMVPREEGWASEAER